MKKSGVICSEHIRCHFSCRKLKSSANIWEFLKEAEKKLHNRANLLLLIPFANSSLQEEGAREQYI
jgi:hypothetical protein